MIKKIKVCGITYDVILKSKEDMFRICDGKDEPIQLMGMVDWPNGEILIGDFLREDIQEVTLWHELAHILLMVIDGDLSENESVVEGIGQMVYQILVDNKELTEIR